MHISAYHEFAFILYLTYSVTVSQRSPLQISFTLWHRSQSKVNVLHFVVLSLSPLLTFMTDIFGKDSPFPHTF